VTFTVWSKRDFMGVECASGFGLGFAFGLLQAHGDGVYKVRLGELGREQWTVGIRVSCGISYRAFHLAGDICQGFGSTLLGFSSCWF